MGLIEVVDAQGNAKPIGGGVVDADGRSALQRQIEGGVAELRAKQEAARKIDAPEDPAAHRITDVDGKILELPLEHRKAPANFMWDRTVPTGWQEQLDRMFPPNDRISWLRLVWVAADETLSSGGRLRVDPVQRWVLFQLTRAVPEPVRAYLEGPPPHPKHNRIPLMREQWDIYHAEKFWAQPYWIIQGEKGGHKRRFTKHEQKLLKAQRLPTDPPEAGDPKKPYAPFDQRVIDKIIAFDHVQFWNRALELYERKPEHLDAEELEAVKATRGWLLTWLESQVDAAIDSVPIGAIETSHDAQPLDVDLERHNLIHADT